MNVPLDPSGSQIKNEAENARDYYPMNQPNEHISQSDHEDDDSIEIEIEHPQLFMSLPGEKESRLFIDIREEEYAEPEPLITTPLLNINQRDNDNTSDDSSYADLEASIPFWQSFYLVLNGGSNETSMEMDVAISSIFLKDYENSRACSLPGRIDAITPFQVRIHNIRYSYSWQCVLFTGIASLFLSSCFDGGQSGWGTRDNRDQIQFMFTLLAAAIFTMDVIMRTIHDYDDIDEEVSGSDGATDISGAQHTQTRKTRARRWKTPVLLIIFAVTVETYIKVLKDGKYYVWSGCLKPIVFFYASTKARDGEKYKCGLYIDKTLSI